MKTYITHYRYKSSEVAHLYKIAKDSGVNAEKFVLKFGVNLHASHTLESKDIFPKGGMTSVLTEDGDGATAHCSFDDNYERRRGVKICYGRLSL